MLQRSDESGKIVGLDELRALAANAETIPVNRVWVSFFSPTMVYEKGSNTMKDTGLAITDDADAGFAVIKEYVTQLQAGGVEVFLSLGGWNYNCFPYLYARYSVAGYGTATPNYWKIEQFGNGNIDNCDETNQWCYVCEPPSEGTSIDSFSIFPEPEWSPTWQTAASMIEAGAGGTAPTWHKDIVPGAMWTDEKTGKSLKVPGSTLFVEQKRDPYADFVQMAADLGCIGVDIYYEEFWMADYYKTGKSTGPWELDQVVYKYSAIMQDVILNIEAIQPAMKLSTAASAVGGWDGKWWGGNLKGVWLQMATKYPDIMKKITDSQGLNIMTYDLSSNPEFHECPEDGVCDLDKQVDYYMKTYETAGYAANVGYEIGTPAYPPPDHDPAHQLPLTNEMLSSIIGNTQSRHKGGFMWELYKNGDGSAEVTQVAQAICKATLGSAARCSGVIPPADSSPTTPPAPTPPTPQAPTPQAPTPVAPSCPGGSLTACITACPTTPISAFTACISVCSTLCPQ